MNKFYESVAKVLEVDAVEGETRFREAGSWCSLQAFGLLVMMENDWKSPISIDCLMGLTTVKDLYREAFLAFAARTLKVGREAISGKTAYGSIPEWDSVNHLRLAMEAENFFGVHYPLERIPYLATIDDFLI